MKDKIIKGLKWFLKSYIWIVILVFVFEIASKWAVQNTATARGLDDGSVLVTIIPNFFHIIISHNLGAAFSLGANGEITWRVVWILVSIIMSIGLSWYYAKEFKKLTLLSKISLTLMIGGAIGNMIDRCFYWNNVVGFDGVIDFLDFEFGSLGHFATFNIADAALVIGVALLIVVMIIDAIQESKRKAARGEYKYSPKELEEMEAKKQAEEASNTESIENNKNKDVNE